MDAIYSAHARGLHNPFVDLLLMIGEHGSYSGRAPRSADAHLSPRAAAGDNS